MAQLAFPEAQAGATSAAVGAHATPRTRGASSRQHSRPRLDDRQPGTDLIWAGGRVLDAWPANPDENEYTRVRDSNVETLLIGGQPRLARRRRRTRRASCCRTCGTATRSCCPGSATPTTSGATSRRRQPSGQHLPRQRPRRRVALHARTGSTSTPFPQTHDREDRPRRPRRLRRADRPLAARAARCVSAAAADSAGRPAPRSGRSTRSCSVSAAGSAASLLALTALPTVPLDSELLACVSIGGVRSGSWCLFASVTGTGPHRTTEGDRLRRRGRRSLRRRLARLHVVSGLFAVLTTAIGATAVSNLAVLVIDIAWHRHAAPAADPVPTPAIYG